MPPSHLYPPDYRNPIDSFNDDDAPEAKRWQRRAGALDAWAAELAATSPDGTSRWLEISMPSNDQKAREHARAAKKIHRRALRLSLSPLLISCGSGAYRLIIAFDQPVATARLRALGNRLARGMQGLVNLLPQKNTATLRLPDQQSKVRTGKTWLSGVDALRAIVSTVGVSPDFLREDDGKASGKAPGRAAQRPNGAKKNTDAQHAVDDDDRDVDEDAQDELFEIPRPVAFDDDEDDDETMVPDSEEEKVTRHPFWIDTHGPDSGGVFIPSWVISAVDEGTEMLLLAQLNYWFTPGQDGRLRARLKRDGEMWVAKTYDELGKEIGRTSRQVQTAVKGLLRKRLLIVERHRSPFHAMRTVAHFRLHLDELDKVCPSKDR